VGVNAEVIIMREDNIFVYRFDGKELGDVSFTVALSKSNTRNRYLFLFPNLEIGVKDPKDHSHVEVKVYRYDEKRRFPSVSYEGKDTMVFFKELEHPLILGENESSYQGKPVRIKSNPGAVISSSRVHGSYAERFMYYPLKYSLLSQQLTAYQYRYFLHNLFMADRTISHWTQH
jgi:hypothetical protein